MWVLVIERWWVRRYGKGMVGASRKREGSGGFRCGIAGREVVLLHGPVFHDRAAGRCFHFDLDQKRGFVGRSGGWRYMGPTPPSKGAARKSGLFGRPSYTNEKPVSFEENWLSWTLR